MTARAGPVLVLGIGGAQTDLVAHCKAMGMTVHACAASAEGPALGAVDHFEPIDIRNAARVAEHARRIGAALVASLGSDLGAETSATVSERLGLPHLVPPEVAALCRDKHRVRTRLGASPANLPCRRVRTSADARAWTAYPAVLKPVDGQGQRGVFVVGSAGEFAARLPDTLAHSAGASAIVEPYIDGPELNASAYLVAGQLTYCRVSARLVHDGPACGLVRAHRIPAPAQQAQAGALTAAAARALGVDDGPVYLQMKNDRGTLRLIEFAARLDGCHLWRLIRDYEGVDLLQLSIAHLLGDAPAPARFEPAPRNGDLELSFVCQPPGTRVAPRPPALAGQLHEAWYYQPGEAVRPVNGTLEKIGYRIRRL